MLLVHLLLLLLTAVVLIVLFDVAQDIGNFNLPLQRNAYFPVTVVHSSQLILVILGQGLFTPFPLEIAMPGHFPN